MKRTTSYAGNAALVVASVLLTLAAFEAVARVAHEVSGPPIPRLYTEPDPLLGWRHRPGAQADFPQGSYVINSRGLRDVEHDEAPDPGRDRILVLGDSFAEGYSVAFEDSVSRALERTLGKAGRPAEVINAGVVGYSTDQELLYYRNDVSRYGAKVVVLFFFYNDILANTLDRIDRSPKPLLDCEGGTLRVTNAPLPPHEPSEGSAHLHLPPPEPWHSAALEWVQQRLSAAPRAYDVLSRLGLWRRFTPVMPPQDLRVYARRPPRADRAAWRCTCRILGALAADVAAHGARLLVAYVPSKLEVSERDWGLTRLRYEIDERDWDRGKVARDLGAAGADLGFPVLDLTPMLRSADSLLLGGPYHSHGGHWNALGHRTAARAVARFLLDRGWLERAAP